MAGSKPMLAASLLKLGEWHIIRYERGDEGSAFAAINDLVESRELDWFEGADLAEKVRKNMAAELVGQ